MIYPLRTRKIKKPVDITLVFSALEYIILGVGLAVFLIGSKGAF